MTEIPFFQRTPEEKVEIVDEDLNVLQTATKLKAHTNGLLHPIVIGEVRNSKGEFLLVKQASFMQDSGQFVAPVGGHIGAGETPEVALKREASEEIGTADFKFKYIGKFIYERKVIGRHENHYFIIFEIETDQIGKLGDESVEIRSFSELELKDILKNNPELIGPPARLIFANFYRQLFYHPEALDK